MILGNIYGLGIIYSRPEEKVYVIPKSFVMNFQEEKSAIENTSEFTILASKSGTKWYFAHCSGAKRIKEENKIYFSSIQEAENRGLEQASGCN